MHILVHLTTLRPVRGHPLAIAFCLLTSLRSAGFFLRLANRAFPCRPGLSLGLAMHTQGVFRTVQAKRCHHAVADAPAQHPPRIPIDHGHALGKAALQAVAGDVLTPDLIGPHHGHATHK